MRECIICVGIGSWYPRGARRMQDTLRNVGYSGDILLWDDDLPPGSPTHHDVPYAFKSYAFEFARARGYGPTLWCDASTWFLRHPQTILDRIHQDGYYLWYNPLETMGEYCADAVLDRFKLDREVAMQVPSTATTVFGLDLQSSTGCEILRRYSIAARDGSFCVAWDNDLSGPPWRPGLRRAFVSTDCRVRGGRHGQTVLGILAHDMGLSLDAASPADLFSYPSVPHSSDVVALAEDDGGLSLDAWDRKGWLKT